MMIQDVSRSTWLHRLGMAERGEWILYYTGFLYEDRTKNRRLNAMAHEVYSQYEQGHVTLIQRRLGDLSYQYYAIRR